MAAWKHVRNRFIERYGGEITRSDVIKIKKLINKTLNKKPQEIEYKGKPITIVYDHSIREIVTVLPNRTYQVMSILCN